MTTDLPSASYTTLLLLLITPKAAVCSYRRYAFTIRSCAALAEAAGVAARDRLEVEAAFCQAARVLPSKQIE